MINLRLKTTSLKCIGIEYFRYKIRSRFWNPKYAVDFGTE